MKQDLLKKKSKGFTLVEVGIVVAIGLLLLAGLAGANRIVAGTKANDEIGELKVAATNLQKSFSAANNFTGLTETVARNLKVFSDSMNSTANATDLISRWNTDMGLVALAATATQPPVAVIQVASVPSYECTSIIPQVAGEFYAVQVTAGAAAVTAPVAAGAIPVANSATFVKTTTAAGGPLPLDVAALAAACNNAAGSANINYYLAK